MWKTRAGEGEVQSDRRKVDESPSRCGKRLRARKRRATRKSLGVELGERDERERGREGEREGGRERERERFAVMYAHS